MNLVRDLVHSYSIPVIGLYGWPDDPDYPERVKAAGASVVIRLPFDLDDLQRVVSDVLTRRVPPESVQLTRVREHQITCPITNTFHGL